MRLTQVTRFTKYIGAAVLIALLIPSQLFSAGQSTSGKTLADITTDVRRQFNEYTATLLADTADIFDWINYATHDIVAKTHCMQQTPYDFEQALAFVKFFPV